MRGAKVLFSDAGNGGSDLWQTPEKVLKVVRQLGPIALDPCSARGNPTRALEFWYRHGISRNWFIFRWSGLTFVNPPYSQIRKWIGKVILESQNGWQVKPLEAVILVPARTDRPWFQSSLNTAQVVTFVRGRLRFKHARYDAPFPSVLFYYGPRPDVALAKFEKLGKTHRLPTPPLDKAHARYWRKRDREQKTRDIPC